VPGGTAFSAASQRPPHDPNAVLRSTDLHEWHPANTSTRHPPRILPPKTLTFASAEAAKIRGPGQITSEYSPKTLPQSLTFDWNRSPLAHPQHGRARLPKSLTYPSNRQNQ
jgi:hypothetical protein